MTLNVVSGTKHEIVICKWKIYGTEKKNNKHVKY